MGIGNRGTGPPRDSVLAIESSADGSRVLIRLSGELDLVTVERFEAEVERVCRNGHRDLVVDLTGLGFCDVRGLHALVEVQARADQDGGTVIFDGASPFLMRLCRMTGIDHVIRLTEPPQGRWRPVGRG